MFEELKELELLEIDGGNDGANYSLRVEVEVRLNRQNRPHVSVP